jgi:hypothetical protein
VRFNVFNPAFIGRHVALAQYIEPVAVGDILPDRPIVLTPCHYVNCPLEATYQATWNVFPAILKAPLERPDAAPETP